jgi:hypothetical protein
VINFILTCDTEGTNSITIWCFGQILKSGWEYLSLSKTHTHTKCNGYCSTELVPNMEDVTRKINTDVAGPRKKYGKWR